MKKILFALLVSQVAFAQFSFKKFENRIECKFDNQTISLQPLSETSIRTKVWTGNAIPDTANVYNVLNASTAFVLLEEQNVLTIKTKGLQVKINKSTGKLSFFNANGKLLLQENERSLKSFEEYDEKFIHVKQCFIAETKEKQSTEI